MSDSDDDSLQNNLFTCNDNTTICAKGPNINNTNITGLSFRTNVMTSTMHMPNFGRQRCGDSNIDHGYYRREVSPMSLRSVPGYVQSHINHSTYRNGIGYQRSIYRGRCGSPTAHSVASTATSVSAADIIFAFRNVKFSKYDLRDIKDAYKKLIKTGQRKKIEKRRKLKLFLKGTRRKSGVDSGEEGSDSSLSEDDSRSLKKTICKENIPGLRQMTGISNFGANMRENANHMTDIGPSMANMKENPMFTDSTENIKQNSLRSMISRSCVSNLDTNERFLNTLAICKQNSTINKMQNISAMTQKERFTKGFLLPSQRFQKNIAGPVQAYDDAKKSKKPTKTNVITSNLPEPQNDYNEKEMLSVNQINTKNGQRKRPVDTEDLDFNKKKNKLGSPNKLQSSETLELACNDIPNGKSNDFNFAKPKMLIKKTNKKKDSIPEILLAKSNFSPIIEEKIYNSVQNNKSKPIQNEVDRDNEDHLQSDTLHSNGDLSMRPSFIKRKLFTQKLDVTEQKNASFDSLSANSPQNIYSASIRERNKARKLVTSQSCLRREVLDEDNNVLDLIHKIVPPNQINITNVANKAETCNNTLKDINNTHKWDVTAIIANCDNRDISDTYTDEEIFDVKQINATESEKTQKSSQNSKKDRQCEIVVEKIKMQTLNKGVKNNKKNDLQAKSMETNKKSVTECVKSFWDTDFESDMECNMFPSKNNVKLVQETTLQKGNNHHEAKKHQINKNPPKGTILTVRNCHGIKFNNSKFYRSLISDDNTGTEDNKIMRSKSDTKGGKIMIKSASETDIKDTGNENVSVNAKNIKPERKARTKQCVDCNTNDNETNKTTQAAKSDENLNNKKHAKKSSYNGNLMITPSNSEDSNECKQTTNKIIISRQKSNHLIQKEPANNVRLQPKRKSKDKSCVQSFKLKTNASDNKAKSTMPKTKSNKEVVPNNTSNKSISTMLTRSREKLLLSFNSSGGDCCSLDVSNTSNRSLRLRQRIQRNIN